MMHVVRARPREMELSPTQKASLLARDVTREGIAMLLGSHKARIIKRFFRRTSYAINLRGLRRDKGLLLFGP